MPTITAVFDTWQRADSALAALKKETILPEQLKLTERLQFNRFSAATQPGLDHAGTDTMPYTQSAAELDQQNPLTDTADIQLEESPADHGCASEIVLTLGIPSALAPQAEEILRQEGARELHRVKLI